jgi:large subunit ribosomal protein L22
MATVETPEIEFRAQARFVRTAPRKAQAVVAEIRGLHAEQARTALRFMTRDAARDVASVLDSAIANAESHPTSSYDAESLYVSAAFVGSGPTLKRWQARARGRVGRIRKRTCHITVRVAPIPGATSVRPTAAEEPRRARRPRAEAAAPAEATAAAEAVETVEAGVEAPEEAAVVETVEEPAQAKPRRSRKAAAEPAEVPPAEDAVVEAPPADEAVAEEAPAEEAAAEEAPAEKPKRTRAAAKPKAEAGEETPKPRRARTPKAEESVPDDAEAPKPRRSRKKPDDTAPEGDE